MLFFFSSLLIGDVSIFVMMTGKTGNNIIKSRNNLLIIHAFRTDYADCTDPFAVNADGMNNKTGIIDRKLVSVAYKYIDLFAVRFCYSIGNCATLFEHIKRLFCFRYRRKFRIIEKFGCAFNVNSTFLNVGKNIINRTHKRGREMTQ